MTKMDIIQAILVLFSFGFVAVATLYFIKKERERWGNEL